jgi:hypothetical protein
VLLHQLVTPATLLLLLSFLAHRIHQEAPYCLYPGRVSLLLYAETGAGRYWAAGLQDRLPLLLLVQRGIRGPTDLKR